MPQNILHELAVAVIGAAWREGGNLVAGKHRNDRAALQARIPFIARGKIILDRTDKGRDHGVDHRRLQLATLIVIEHLEHRHDTGQKRFAAMLTTALFIMYVQNTAAAKGGCGGDALPIADSRAKTRTDIPGVTFADIIGARRAVGVNLDAAAQRL